MPGIQHQSRDDGGGSAAYDSWVTVAPSSDDLSDGEAQLIPGAWIDSFEGNSITVDDNIGSGWYLIPPGGLNGVSGDDNRVWWRS